MTYVTVNAMTVSGENAQEFVRRFEQRPGRIEDVDGFERFEVLRPVDQRTQWLVITHWRDEASFRAWSQARTPRAEAVADSHELWVFDVEQSSAAS